MLYVKDPLLWLLFKSQQTVCVLDGPLLLLYLHSMGSAVFLSLLNCSVLGVVGFVRLCRN